MGARFGENVWKRARFNQRWKPSRSGEFSTPETTVKPAQRLKAEQRIGFSRDVYEPKRLSANRMAWRRGEERRGEERVGW